MHILKIFFSPALDHIIINYKALLVERIAFVPASDESHCRRMWVVSPDSVYSR